MVLMVVPFDDDSCVSMVMNYTNQQYTKTFNEREKSVNMNVDSIKPMYTRAKIISANDSTFSADEQVKV